MAEPQSQPDPMLDQPRDPNVWGDDREEIDASAVVEEIAAGYPDTERAWHERAVFVPFKAVGLFIRRSGKRIAVTVAGVAVMLVGLAGLVLPFLTGWLLIFVGLGILATEYVWAERLLKAAKRRAVQAKDAVMRKKAAGDDGGAA
jgi:uncharacterized protein (TIGR02611 family)